MAVKRPAIISVVGILNIIFGSLGLLTIVCCGPMAFLDSEQWMKAMAPQAAGAQRPANEFSMGDMKEVPGWTAFTTAGLGVGAVTGSLLLASGIGLMKMKKWGQTLGIAYAILGIVWGTGSTIINQRLMGPKIVQMYEKFQEDIKKSQAQARGGVIPPPKQEVPEAKPAGAAETDHSVLLGVYFAVVLISALLFPVIELILMLLPAVRRGLAGLPSPGWTPEVESVNDNGPDDATWNETVRQ
jgi:hypothetical protein